MGGRRGKMGMLTQKNKLPKMTSLNKDWILFYYFCRNPSSFENE